MELTVAVCTYRRFPWLKKCLEALARQTLSRDQFRVIVVDNSLQPAESAAFRKDLPEEFNLDYIVTEKAGLSYARNVALEKCDTPYIAYIDDDAIAAPDWAERLLAAFHSQNGAAGVVGGKVRPIFETPKPAWLAGELLLYLAIPDWGDEPFELKPNDGKWLVGANIAYLTQALRCAGGFPEQLGRKENLLLCHEEYWINQAVRRQGLVEYYAPDVVVDHLIQTERMTPKWLCEAAFWEGISWVLCRANAQSKEDLVNAEHKHRLIATLNKLADRIPEKPQTRALQKTCISFKESGYAAMKELGFALDPDPSAVAGSSIPTVFLITTCMNAAETIGQTIQSIVTQTGSFYVRYHIQDAGSRDDTIKIVKKWQRDLQTGAVATTCSGVYLSYCVEKDTGMYDGITRAFGHLNIPAEAFMTWLNADDMLFPGAIATIADIQTQLGQVDWITGQIYCTRNNGGLCQSTSCGFPRWFIQRGLCETRFWQCVQQEGTFWRKRLWDAAGGLNTKLRLAGDFDLWCRFANHAEMWHFQGPLASFHRRPGQLSEDFGRYAREMDALVPKEQKERDWEWIVNALKQGSEPFTISCLYYDWGSDSYKETYPPVREFLPPWKKNLIPATTVQTASAASALPPPPAAQIPPATPTENPVQVRAPAATEQPPKRQQALPKPPKPRPPALTKLSSIKRQAVRWWDYRALRASALFCDAYYLRSNPDVAILGVDPLLHYLRHGWQEGRNPNPVFQTWYYLQHNPDVKAAGANPLLHFWRRGAAEGRNPSETFNTSRYLDQHPELRQTGENPLAHYLRTALLNELPLDLPALAMTPPPLPQAAARASRIRETAPADWRITPETFAAFTYSKRSHLPLLAAYAPEVYGRSISNWDDEDLKRYQDLLVYAFIRQNILPGSRILEIGGGTDNRVLRALAKEYECWNLDRFADKPAGARFRDASDGIEHVNDYLGTLNANLADAAFDFAFSVSVFEDIHPRPTFPAKQRDLQRLLRPGATALHTSSVTLRNHEPPAFPAFFRWIDSQKQSHFPLPPSDELHHCDDLFCLSESAYNRLWMPYTNLAYAAYGRPVSINLLLDNQMR